jgi:opacity protein-like surface antigen
MIPAESQAQGFGIGPRFSFVSSDLDSDGRNRYTGGMLRLRTSEKSAIEVSFDYRNHLNESLKARIKDFPIQASFLFYPVRRNLAPYLVGGIGWYKHSVDPVEGDLLPESVSTRKTGYHAGLGADIWMGRRATLHLDYRYTFIGFGGDESEPGVLPLPGLGGLQDKLNLSHDGSMWTTGLTIYF